VGCGGVVWGVGWVGRGGVGSIKKTMNQFNKQLLPNYL